MARVIGSEAGGYATVQPTENYVGQAIQNQEANAFRYREEARAKEAKKVALERAKQEALAKKAQQDIEDAEKLNAIRAKDSGFSGIDSAVNNGLQAARQKYIDAKLKYNNTLDKRYLAEMSSAMTDLNSITNIPTAYKKSVDNIREGVLNGTLNRSEEKRITTLADKIEKGFVVPKIENGIMTFDVFERDPNTGKLSGIAINNMKGEDLISQLTPGKRLDYNKHIKEIQGLAGNPTTSVVNGLQITGYPNADKYAKGRTEDLFKDSALLDDVAQFYGIEEDPKTGYTDADKKAIYERYYNDIISGLNTGTKPNYEQERLDLARQRERRLAANEGRSGSKPTVEPFEPPVSVVTKGGIKTSLGIDTRKGDKILSPTYKDGKEGPVRGVVLRDDGTYDFAISTRKDNSLNAQGLLNKKKFEENPANAGKEFEPSDSDYVYSIAKPSTFTSKKDAEVLNTYVRGMLNPETGNNFNSFREYKNVYNKYKPKKSSSAKTAAKTSAKAKASAAKIYAGVDENGKIIYK